MEEFMDIAREIWKHNLKTSSFPWVKRQFPAYGLYLELLDNVLSEYPMETLLQLLSEVPPDEVWGCYDAYNEGPLKRWQHFLPVWKMMAAPVAEYVAYAIAPTWGPLKPIKTWDEYKERKKKGWAL